MALVIVAFDFFLWRPALIWAHKYRLEDSDSLSPQDPMMIWVIEKSWIAQKLKKKILKTSLRKQARQLYLQKIFFVIQKISHFFGIISKRWIWASLGLVFSVYLISPAYKLFEGLIHLPLNIWGQILQDTSWTFLRVIGTLIIGTIWTTPLALWISLHPKRMQWAQPIIQMLASFPAPMLYPLAMGIFITLKINFEISSMLLMLLGVQWYILFNVLAGATRIPQELRLNLELIRSSSWSYWRYLLIPSILPSLVTGWVTAAGGAWNASIVSELITYKGQTLRARGLGSFINEAAENADFTKLTAGLLVMVAVVVLFNRSAWAKLYKITQTRFRLDL